MLNLIKAELFKFKKSKSIWIILFSIILFCSISIFTGVYSSAENTFLNITKDVMIMILSLAIYCGISFSGDFQSRTILHYVVAGQKRSHIIIALFLRYFIGCTVLILAYPLVCTFLAGIVNGFETSAGLVLVKMVKIIFMSVPLYLSIASLFFMVMILVRQGVATMGISVALAIALVVFTNKLYFGNIEHEVSIWCFSPIIELQALANNLVTADYFISLLVSIVTILIVFFISKFAFQKAEIK